MNQQTIHPPVARTRTRVWGAVLMLCLAGLLNGCSRPTETDIQRLLNQSYTCKYTELVEITRTNAMPGIYSFVAQYGFYVRFKDGEAGAQKFFQGLFSEVAFKGTEEDIEKWLKSETVQDYLSDECTEPAQLALESMTARVLQQMAEKKDKIMLPYVQPVRGWSEFMPSKRGWDITIRRDYYDGEPQFTEPLKFNVAPPKTKPAGKKTSKS